MKLITEDERLRFVEVLAQATTETIGREFPPEQREMAFKICAITTANFLAILSHVEVAGLYGRN